MRCMAVQHTEPCVACEGRRVVLGTLGRTRPLIRGAGFEACLMWLMTWQVAQPTT